MMAGLLGDMEDPRTQGLLSLGFGLLNSRGNFGQALGQAGPQAMEQFNQASQMLQRRKALDQNMQLQAAQIKETEAQALQRQQQAEELRRKFMEQQRIQEVVRNAVSPTAPINANDASGIAGPRPEALAAVGQRAPIDYRALIAAGVPPDLVKHLADSGDYGRPEVARTIEQMGAAGPETVQFDKFGGRVGGGIAKPVEAKMMDRGGSLQAYNPFTLAQLGSFGKTMTPGEVASNGIAGANLGISRERLAFDKTQAGKPQFHDGSWVTPPTAQNPQGGSVQVPGFSKPLTEAQGNATAFSMRAKNALENLNNVDTITNGDYYASRLPWGTGNFMMSPEGQKAMNAEKQFIGAMLRKDSGAAISHGEYKEAGDQLFPRPGDTQDQLEQKAKNRDVVISSMEVQAGQSGARQGADALRSLPDRKPNLPPFVTPADPNGGWSIKPRGQ